MGGEGGEVGGVDPAGEQAQYDKDQHDAHQGGYQNQLGAAGDLAAQKGDAQHHGQNNQSPDGGGELLVAADLKEGVGDLTGGDAHRAQEDGVHGHVAQAGQSAEGGADDPAAPVIDGARLGHPHGQLTDGHADEHD